MKGINYVDESIASLQKQTLKDELNMPSNR